jgi:hypothetical protein
MRNLYNKHSSEICVLSGPVTFPDEATRSLNWQALKRQKWWSLKKSYLFGRARRILVVAVQLMEKLSCRFSDYQASLHSPVSLPIPCANISIAALLCVAPCVFPPQASSQSPLLCVSSSASNQDSLISSVPRKIHNQASSAREEFLTTLERHDDRNKQENL